MDPSQLPQRRRRDRLRALLPSPSSIFRRPSLRSRSVTENTSNSSLTAHRSQPPTGDLASRQGSSDPWLENEEDEDSEDVAERSSERAPAYSISRRMSMTLRGLLTPRNRDGSTSSTSRLSHREPPDPFPPPAVDADRSFQFVDSIPTSPIPLTQREETYHSPTSNEETTADERRARRLTWGPGTSTRPTSDMARSVANSDEVEALSPLRRHASQQIPSISATSPLSSLSSLFSRTSSNISSPSTAPTSASDAGSSAVLRAGAARIPTRTSMGISDVDNQTASNFDQMRLQNMRRLSRLSRARSRLRQELDTLRARHDDEHIDISEIQRLVRHLGRTGARSGNDTDDEGDRIDGMAPFTIVGIRRVDPNGEGSDEDILPQYLRDLVDTTPHGHAESGADDIRQERHSRFGNARRSRQRRVLSFYDRMEFLSREAGGRLQRSRPRSMYGSGSLRRNGVVEPDSPEDDGPRHETYVIYLISGVLPENHPLLAAPSLFTDNPSYEDMLLIASLLGPAKPPVATSEEVDAASGLFVIEIEAVADGQDKLVAVARDGDERISLPPVMDDGVERPDRCLICLSDFEVHEEVRKLAKCGHLYHKDCIGHWLTEGRNSCPLCRGEGVNKTTTETTT